MRAKIIPGFVWNVLFKSGAAGNRLADEDGVWAQDFTDEAIKTVFLVGEMRSADNVSEEWLELLLQRRWNCAEFLNGAKLAFHDSGGLLFKMRSIYTAKRLRITSRARPKTDTAL